MEKILTSILLLATITVAAKPPHHKHNVQITVQYFNPKNGQTLGAAFDFQATHTTIQLAVVDKTGKQVQAAVTVEKRNPVNKIQNLR